MPAWCSYPDADPPPDAAAFAFWRIPATSNCSTTARAGADRAQPGHCLRFALAPGLEDGMAVAYAHRGGAAAPAAAMRRCAGRPMPAQADACGAAGAAHLQALDATLAGASLREVAEGCSAPMPWPPTGTPTAACAPACAAWCGAAMR
jgi:hypothetical protein